MQKITPFLWFDGQAEEAANFYVSTFANSRIVSVDRYGADAAKAAGRADGSVMTVAFELDGQRFAALNGGPVFKFNEAISFVVYCATQQELDTLWNSLAQGGEEIQCGWLKDRFGVTWQIVPSDLEALLKDADPDKSSRAWQALLGMKKIDIEALRRARDGN